MLELLKAIWHIFVQALTMGAVTEYKNKVTADTKRAVELQEQRLRNVEDKLENASEAELDKLNDDLLNRVRSARRNT